MEFIVRSTLAESEAEPSSRYWLRKLTPTANRREILMNTLVATPLGASLNTHPTEGVLPVEFSRYGPTSYKLKVSLPPGEYAFSRAGARNVFCFGVD